MNEQTQSSETQFNSDAMKIPEGSVVNSPARVSGKGFGLVLGLLFVVLLLILGGMYYWFVSVQPATLESYGRPTAEENKEPESTNARAGADALTTLSTSNELEAIRADIESTDIQGINSDMQAIEAEITAAAGAPRP